MNPIWESSHVAGFDQVDRPIIDPNFSEFIVRLLGLKTQFPFICQNLIFEGLCLSLFLSVCNGLQGFTRTIRPIPLLAQNRAQGP